MGSEVTAAIISDKIGQVRRDPFAMLPFIGYHVGDYLNHWLSIGRKADPAKLPKIFAVNWFRRGDDGRFLWPGFGENSRVLKWVAERCDEAIGAHESAIGYLPRPEDLDLEGLELPAADLEAITTIDRQAWLAELEAINAHFKTYGHKMPRVLFDQLERVRNKLIG